MVLFTTFIQLSEYYTCNRLMRQEKQTLHLQEVHDYLCSYETTLSTQPSFQSTWVHPVFCGVCVARSFVLCVGSLFVLFLLVIVCCLSFGLQILITPSISSNSSQYKITKSIIFMVNIKKNYKQLFSNSQSIITSSLL